MNSCSWLVFFLFVTLSPLLARTASGQQAGAGQAIPNLSGIWEAPHELNDVYAKGPRGDLCGEGACDDILEIHPDELVITVEEPQMLPWAEERYKASREEGSEHPRQEADPWFSACTPFSPGSMMLSPFIAVELRQFPDVVLLLLAGTAGEGDHTVRRVYVDGRGHPANVRPTWMGHSIGHYDGDTLVVDTIGIKGDRWLDLPGHSHTDALHLVERIRHVDQSRLEFQVTIDDPTAYKNSWAMKIVRQLAVPGPRLWDEANCEELLQMGTHYGAQ